MKISIAERLHPFSHVAGTKFLLPGTTWVVQVFPTRLKFFDVEGQAEPFFLQFDFKGPLAEFTAELDLEKARLNVFGKTKEGFMRYLVFAKEDGIYLTLEKAPHDKAVCQRSFPPEKIVLAKGESLLICLPLKGWERKISQERLSLGMHKSQDWDLVCRRLDLKEIFPLWYRMAALVPPPTEPMGGNYPLLEICQKKIEQGERATVLEAFENLFLASVDGVFVPTATDSKYQGIIEECEAAHGPALPLLTEAGKCIRSLFFQEKEAVISVLPCLPTKMHCGRMMQMKTSKNAVLDFEWTKNALRSVLIASEIDQEICLRFPKGIRSFRWKTGTKMTQAVSVDKEGRAVLTLHAGKIACLDRFEY